MTKAHRSKARDSLGVPAPHEVLDPEFKPEPKRDVALVSAFVKTLIPARNPQLRTAAQMRKLGFTGVAHG